MDPEVLLRFAEKVPDGHGQLFRKFQHLFPERVVESIRHHVLREGVIRDSLSFPSPDHVCCRIICYPEFSYLEIGIELGDSTGSFWRRSLWKAEQGKLNVYSSRKFTYHPVPAPINYEMEAGKLLSYWFLDDGRIVGVEYPTDGSWSPICRVLRRAMRREWKRRYQEMSHTLEQLLIPVFIPVVLSYIWRT